MSAALGMLSICLPVSVLEPVLDKLSTEQCMGGARRNTSDHFAATVSKGLSKVPVKCSAVLGGATVTVRDLVNLSVGDIIRLDSSPQADLTLAVGDHAKFICRPGLVGNKMAVQIIQVKDGVGIEAA
jgi:flagellar motor switch protein FliM